MKRLIPISMMVIAASLLFAAAGMAEDDKSAEARWTENLKQAIAVSKKTGKPILANFTGSDWCGFCIKQEKEVFSTEAFAEWAQDNAVLLTVDFPNRKPQSAEIKKQNQQLKEKFKPRGFPTVIFFDAKGNELGRFAGYSPGSGPERWIEKAQPIVDKASKSG